MTLRSSSSLLDFPVSLSCRRRPRTLSLVLHDEQDPRSKPRLRAFRYTLCVPTVRSGGSFVPHVTRPLSSHVHAGTCLRGSTALNKPAYLQQHHNAALPRSKPFYSTSYLNNRPRRFRTARLMQCTLWSRGQRVYWMSNTSEAPPGGCQRFKASSADSRTNLIDIVTRSGVCSNVVAPSSVLLTRTLQTSVGMTTQLELWRAHAKHDTHRLTSGGGQRKKAKNIQNNHRRSCKPYPPLLRPSVSLATRRNKTCKRTLHSTAKLFLFPCRTQRSQ